MSLTALARIAERYVRAQGSVDAQDLVALLTEAANGNRERAEAGLRLAIIGRRVFLDRGATIRTV